MGDRDAATALFLKYAHRLEDLARKKSGRDLASRFDPEDVVQSVFRTFFRRASEGQYQLPDGDELWKLLLVITLNKLRRLAIHHRAKKRNTSQTVELHEDESPRSLISSPEEGLAVLQDMIQTVMSDLPESHQKMIRLRIDGASLEEISQEVARSRRTVERVIQQFRERLRHMIDSFIEDEEALD